ncbi:GNAT family N-acetyltransferase [Geminocystis sp. GBBB08]|uniref:GNAT family N-acetyltransferase n=1 Tax=Geminocystis sp. GBBB08 TaxID=2604140 RepID=UPI0027E27259|nr:GNAT family N-acetyltransferase [Geminocystis sp. GBBB08]MBL1208876.1 GNAT family N-acetyltransferase [Geminocystis sp. GBBB08]
MNNKINDNHVIFKEIDHKDSRSGISFGLFKQDGTQVGISVCLDNFRNKEEDAWHLDKIEIFSEFERQGYGSYLLDKTCETLFTRNRKPIILQRPSNTIAEDGFDRKKWYENHGFISHPNPEITFMWKEP